MRCKTLASAAAAIIFGMFTTGCTILEKVVYRPDINQGNYLSPGDVSKIHNGMTKQQVANTLGTPMMQDPFGTSTWFYIFRQQPGREKVTQQTLTLTFDKKDILTGIKNELVLIGDGS